MLASIHPLGERSRSNRWGLTAAAHVAGSALGGVLAGAALGGLGRLLITVMGPHWGSRQIRGWLVVAIALVAAGIELLGGRPPWPVRRQVDDAWLRRYRGWVYGGAFGFQLGLAVVTIVTTAAVLAAWLAALLSASPAVGATVGALFGLSRGLPLLATAGITSPARLWSFQRRFQSAAPLARRLTVLSLSVSAAVGGTLLAVHP
ncbi:MAG: hypothetical protein NVSMB32_01270 [Actinomycetota bacterium]